MKKFECEHYPGWETALRSKAMNTESQTTTYNPSYYLMKNGFILRLEEPLDLQNIPLLIKANMLEPNDPVVINQEQANYRVAIFRDEILEMPEYQQRVFGIA